MEVEWSGLSKLDFNLSIQTYGNKIREKKCYEQIREEEFSRLGKIRPLPVLDERSLVSDEVKDDFEIELNSSDSNNEGVFTIESILDSNVLNEINETGKRIRSSIDLSNLVDRGVDEGNSLEDGSDSENEDFEDDVEDFEDSEDFEDFEDDVEEYEDDEDFEDFEDDEQPLEEESDLDNDDEFEYDDEEEPWEDDEDYEDDIEDYEDDEDEDGEDEDEEDDEDYEDGVEEYEDDEDDIIDDYNGESEGSTDTEEDTKPDLGKGNSNEDVKNKDVSKDKSISFEMLISDDESSDFVDSMINLNKNKETKSSSDSHKDDLEDEEEIKKNLPSNPIEYLKRNPRSLESEVKRYYSPKEVDNYINRGLIQRSRGKLFI